MGGWGISMNSFFLKLVQKRFYDVSEVKGQCWCGVLPKIFVEAGPPKLLTVLL